MALEVNQILAGDGSDVLDLDETRLAAVEALFAASANINERGWLNAARRALLRQLGR